METLFSLIQVGLPWPCPVAYSIPRKGMETSTEFRRLPEAELLKLPTQFPARGWKQS